MCFDLIFTSIIRNIKPGSDHEIFVGNIWFCHCRRQIFMLPLMTENWKHCRRQIFLLSRWDLLKKSLPERYAIYIAMIYFQFLIIKFDYLHKYDPSSSLRIVFRMQWFIVEFK